MRGRAATASLLACAVLGAGLWLAERGARDVIAPEPEASHALPAMAPPRPPTLASAAPAPVASRDPRGPDDAPPDERAEPDAAPDGSHAHGKDEPEELVEPAPPPELLPDPPAGVALELPPACAGAGIRGVAALQRALVIPENAPMMGLVIPPHLRPVLSGVKDRLIDHASRCLASLPADAEPGAVVATLEKSFVEAGVVRGRETVGALVEHRLAWSAHRAGVMILHASLALPCGADDVAVVFERRGGRLARTLVVRADGYAEIYGGNQALSVTLSRGGDDFFVTTTASSPWCTSCWRGFKYAVHTRGEGGVFHKAASGYDSAYACADDEVRADERGVRIDYVSWDEVGDEIRRERQVAFSVAGGAAAAVAPQHRDPVTTVNAFLLEPWATARGMVDPAANVSGIEAVHRRLRASKKAARWGATVASTVANGSVHVVLAPREPTSHEKSVTLTLAPVERHWVVTSAE